MACKHVGDGGGDRHILVGRGAQAQQAVLVGAPGQHLPAAAHRHAVQPACTWEQARVQKGPGFCAGPLSWPNPAHAASPDIVLRQYHKLNDSNPSSAGARPAQDPDSGVWSRRRFASI